MTELPAKRQRQRITKRTRAMFLEALAAGWVVRHAAERFALGVASAEQCERCRAKPGSGPMLDCKT